MPSILRRLLGPKRPRPRPRTAKPEPTAKTAPSTTANTAAKATANWFEVKREHHAPVGLPREFLHDPNQLAAIEQRLLPLLEEREVIQALERDEVPIPATADRAYYYDQMHLNYWLSGLADLREMRRLVPNASLAHVLDFGGATGRFARHVSLAEPSATVTIAEINHNNILWCNENFGPAVRAIEVSQHCHFPLPDDSVSLCVGFSIFTHIDRYESGWLAEIRRVLQPGGYAYFTIHSEDTWARLPSLDSMLGMQLDPQFKALYQAHPTMPAERLVFEHQPGTIYHYCNTFFHTDYIRRVWGKWFDIVNICLGGKKTAVVLKKS